jgi:hypothetical protein
LTTIGYNAFGGCYGLTSVSIPDGVTSIEPFAFFTCSSLTSVSIPNGVTTIGEYAFDYCSKLTSITIPGSVTSIGDGAFERADMSSVVSLVREPFSIKGKDTYDGAFSENTFNNATLYVPEGTIDKFGPKRYAFCMETAGVLYQNGTRFDTNRNFFIYHLS